MGSKSPASSPCSTDLTCQPQSCGTHPPLRTPNTPFLSFELLPVPLRFLPIVGGSLGNSLSLDSCTGMGVPTPSPIFVSSMPFSTDDIAYGFPGAENG